MNERYHPYLYSFFVKTVYSGCQWTTLCAGHIIRENNCIMMNSLLVLQWFVSLLKNQFNSWFHFTKLFLLSRQGTWEGTWEDKASGRQSWFFFFSQFFIENSRRSHRHVLMGHPCDRSRYVGRVINLLTEIAYDFRLC